MITKEQRGMMAAHLCDLAGIAFRNGEVDTGLSLAEWATEVITANAVTAYTYGLREARLPPEDIDASVSAVMRGKHPADSLMGRVAKMRDGAEREGCEDARYVHGKVDAYDRVLDTLEGEGRSARTAGGGT